MKRKIFYAVSNITIAASIATSLCFASLVIAGPGARRQERREAEHREHAEQHLHRLQAISFSRFHGHHLPTFDVEYDAMETGLL